jgi:hypothetical protein
MQRISSVINADATYVFGSKFISLSPNSELITPNLFQKDEAQPGEIGDDGQSAKKDTNKWKGGQIESQYAFFKTDAGDEKVDPQGWDRSPNFQIGKENDPEMKRMDSIGLSNRRDERDDDD